MPLSSPLLRTVAQLDDPVFLGVLAQSLLWTVASFAAILAGLSWGLGHVLPQGASWQWLARLLGGIGALLLAFWLFLPVAIGIATLFIDRVAQAVERRCYPHLPPAQAAPLRAQIWDGAVVSCRLLQMTLLSLVLALLLPGIGVLLGWMISAWAIGRGLFVAVAMRRMSRPAALILARRRRGPILLHGAVLALMAFLPPLNLLVPVAGVAVMVHLLHTAPSGLRGL